jgi:hypothetical protein
MSTIMSKFNNVPNYNDASLPMLGMKFYDTYGFPLNVKSGPFNFNYLKKYMDILGNFNAFINPSVEQNRQMVEIKEYIIKVTGLPFLTMELVMTEFVHWFPELLRPYCETNKDGMISILFLVYFGDGQRYALINITHNPSCEEQDMFRAFIFKKEVINNHDDASKRSLDDDRRYVNESVVAERAEERAAYAKRVNDFSPTALAACLRGHATRADKHATATSEIATSERAAAERAEADAKSAAANAAKLAKRATYAIADAGCAEADAIADAKRTADHAVYAAYRAYRFCVRAAIDLGEAKRLDKAAGLAEARAPAEEIEVARLKAAVIKADATLKARDDAIKARADAMMREHIMREIATESEPAKASKAAECETAERETYESDVAEHAESEDEYPPLIEFE